MAFLSKLFSSRGRSKTSPAGISNPLALSSDDVVPDPRQRQSADKRQRSTSSGSKKQHAASMDLEHRRTPPTPLKLRGNNNYFSLTTTRVPSSPLPPLPSFTSFASDEHGSPGNYSDPEVGGSYSRGVGRFERARTESEAGGLLSPDRLTPMTRLSMMSTDTDGGPEFVPISSSPPKLSLSFETSLTDSGPLDDLDTPPSHRMSIRPTFRPRSTYGHRMSSSPERILTGPSPVRRTSTAEQITTIDPPPQQNRTTTTNVKQLRRSSAIYKRRPSQDGTETSSSKSGKSTLDSPEDRDSGFHEDMDEALRSKQPSPDKTTMSSRRNDGSTRSRQVTAGSVEPRSTAVTPERAPLIPNDGRMTPITLTDPGVVKKPIAMLLPQIEKMETFKETFSTNLFENTIPPDSRDRKFLLSPKPITPNAKGKVMSQAEFERLRQQADADSDDDEEEEDLVKDETYQADLERQRRRQQAALSVYRQQMTKVVGAEATPQIPPRPMSSIDSIAEADDETEEIPLAVLMAHGFPQTNNRPSSSQSAQGNRPQVVLEPRIRSPSPGNLPIFAKNLPMDPHSMYGGAATPVPGLPRSSSAFDLRQSARPSAPSVGGRSHSSPSVPLLDLYQSRDGKGSVYLNPSQIQAQQTQIANQMMAAQEQAYYNQMQYDFMGMQPVPTANGMIQYVPVVVTPPMGSPNMSQSQPGTLFQEVIGRQQTNEQIRQARMSQAPQPQYPQAQTPQPQYPQPQYPQPQYPQPQYPQPQYPQPQYSQPQYPAAPPVPMTNARPQSVFQRPESVYQRPQSIFQDPRRSMYDQKSIYSNSSQQPTARPKLPSTNPAHRVSTLNATGGSPVASGRYRASVYAGAGLGVSGVSAQSSPDLSALPIIPADDDDDDGWNALLRKKQEMAARRVTRLQTAV